MAKNKFEYKKTLPVLKSGVIPQMMIDNEKRKFTNRLAEHLEKYIYVRQHYPNNGTAEVTFSLDKALSNLLDNKTEV